LKRFLAQSDKKHIDYANFEEIFGAIMVFLVRFSQEWFTDLCQI
jgi:hypothetical protein